MGLKVTNNAFGTLNAGITSSATTIVLAAGQGARFPSLSAGDYFYATLIDTSNNLEIVKVTARSTDTMTVVRGQDGTTARAYSTNDRFELRPTAVLFNEIIQAVDNITPAGVSDKNNTSTGYFDLPAGTTAQRPGSANVGYIRYNTTLEQLEMYDGSEWVSVKSVFTATGGTITDAGGFRYHTFTTSGTFQVTKGVKTIDYLIVAGGGAGGWDWSGGGGAGGYLSGSTSVSVNSYTVTVGAGGAVPTNVSTKGFNGANSSAFSLTAIGGGGGGSDQSDPGASGGSGGGGAIDGGGGSGTAGQGNAGAGGNRGDSLGGGGGGGAGAAGSVSSGSGGNGGVGLQWSNGTFYAGGGGGGRNGTAGTGGAGGGGNGGNGSNAGLTAGSANTGGGGGGGGAGQGAAGGSGVVIIRYQL